MQAYFLKLFDYDFATNQTMINAVTAANGPGNTVKLLSHILTSGHIWLQRCSGDQNANTDEMWSIKPVETLQAINQQNYNGWIDFLNYENNFDRKITYVNSKGNQYTDSLYDILAHVINHGTHHRAQIGQQLRFAGTEKLPVTDYAFYLREHGS